LRLATSNPRKLDGLTQYHFGADCVHADYFDSSSLDEALVDVDAVFVITPNFIDEQSAMGNLVAAIKRTGTVRHVVRLTGDPIGVYRTDQVPSELVNWGSGTAIKHLSARRVLEESGLPVTFMNVAGYFMDNFLTLFAAPLKQMRALALPFDHRMAFIDPNDVGEACAAVVTSGDHRHIGKTYHLDNGHDILTFTAVAALLSEVLGEEIQYDGRPETFIELNGPGLAKALGRPDAATYFVEYLRWEREMSTVWRRTDILPFLLGRPGKTLLTWMVEHEWQLKTMLCS
jgi:uncharacterized protein YbjT (DUF2867 family)